MIDPTIGDGSWMAKPGGWRLQFWRSSCQVHLWTGGKSGFLSLGFSIKWMLPTVVFLWPHAEIAEFVCVGYILLDPFRSLRCFWNFNNKLEWRAGATCNFDGPEAQPIHLRFRVLPSQQMSNLLLFNWLTEWLLQTYRAFASPVAPLAKVVW
jgi:hypothetical protein